MVFTLSPKILSPWNIRCLRLETILECPLYDIRGQMPKQLPKSPDMKRRHNYQHGCI